MYQCCGFALVSMQILIRFLPQFGSGYWESNQCESMQIRILVGLCRRKKLNFYMKNILHVDNRL
jgi:hypothetical protein